MNYFTVHVAHVTNPRPVVAPAPDERRLPLGERPGSITHAVKMAMVVGQSCTIPEIAAALSMTERKVGSAIGKLKKANVVTVHRGVRSEHADWTRLK